MEAMTTVSTSSVATDSSAAQELEFLSSFDVPALPVRLRFLRESDCASLEWHGGADLRAWYEQQWRSHQAGDVCVLIADWNDFPIGQIAIHWRGKPTHPHIPDLQSLRVLGAFGRMGIGSRLLECAERVVASRDFDQLSLAVGTKNPRARALYERLGYQPIGEQYDDEWHYIGARGEQCSACEVVIDMVKSLEASTTDGHR